MALRVISGTAGGLHLQSPKKHPLRPTQDRIRQVIFSSLAERVPGAHVLDLYAGTGSFGIEALSRGAASALFVEQEAEATRCILDNLRHCRLTGGEVQQADVATWLKSRPARSFDLIFADPPYLKQRGPLENDLPLDQMAALLAPKGLFVWEHYAERRFGAAPGWEVIRQRDYGETGLTFLTLLREK
jgi:16S rRNA (guanine966-N2)-methyltransferase